MPTAIEELVIENGVEVRVKTVTRDDPTELPPEEEGGEPQIIPGEITGIMRQVFYPGDDLSTLPQEIQGAAIAAWTPQAVNAWRQATGIGLPLTPEQQTAETLTAIDRLYDDKVAHGVPYELQGDAVTFQIREQDKSNWLTFRDACKEQIAAGGGEEPMAMPMWTTANQIYQVTANEGLAATTAIRAGGLALLLRYRQLKSAVEAGQSPDITSGWPW